MCLLSMKLNCNRIIYSIFYRFNLEWKTRTLEVFTKQLDVTWARKILTCLNARIKIPPSQLNRNQKPAQDSFGNCLAVG